MQLSAFEMQLSYYNISRQLGNNYFSITINNTNNVIQIADGNYTAQALTDYLNALIPLNPNLNNKIKVTYGF